MLQGMVFSMVEIDNASKHCPKVGIVIHVKD